LWSWWSWVKLPTTATDYTEKHFNLVYFGQHLRPSPVAPHWSPSRRWPELLAPLAGGPPVAARAQGRAAATHGPPPAARQSSGSRCRRPQGPLPPQTELGVVLPPPTRAHPVARARVPCATGRGNHRGWCRADPGAPPQGRRPPAAARARGRLLQPLRSPSPGRAASSRRAAPLAPPLPAGTSRLRPQLRLAHMGREEKEERNSGLRLKIT
jgi:hypothetical protein